MSSDQLIYPENVDERPKPLSHEEMVKRGFVASCLNCECFLKRKEHCKQFNARPPANVIVFGCEYWYIEIPF